ncbi:MAG: rhomboid family intramembrane serine protease [Clostridia bacterium]|nr:rhomboid family intramembrane serine protease [Clostridia bacterium]
MKIPYNVERTLRRYSISNLMTYIVAAMAAVYVIDLVLPINLYSYMMLTRSGILSGQIWRLVSFVALPPNASLLWIIFSLYFYWMIGTTLENQWGTFKFNLFYLVGTIGSIIACMITGYADNYYLNMSLFLAFAALNPNFQLMLFFIIPIKVKYIALLDVVLFVYSFIVGGWSARATIIVALANIWLFLGGDFINTIRRESSYWKTRYNFRKNMRG